MYMYVCVCMNLYRSLGNMLHLTLYIFRRAPGPTHARDTVSDRFVPAHVVRVHLDELRRVRTTCFNEFRNFSRAQVWKRELHVNVEQGPDDTRAVGWE